MPCGRIGAQALQDLPAVNVAHHDVQHNGVWLQCTYLGQCYLAFLYEYWVVAEGFEVALEKVEGLWVIIYDGDHIFPSGRQAETDARLAGLPTHAQLAT